MHIAVFQCEALTAFAQHTGNDMNGEWGMGRCGKEWNRE